MQQAGDVLLSVDSRLAWSLDMSILTLENEGFLDMINRSEEATSFGGFFDRYRSRLDSMRKRYFDVKENGAFILDFDGQVSSSRNPVYRCSSRLYHLSIDLALGGKCCFAATYTPWQLGRARCIAVGILVFTNARKCTAMLAPLRSRSLQTRLRAGWA